MAARCGIIIIIGRVAPGRGDANMQNFIITDVPAKRHVFIKTARIGRPAFYQHASIYADGAMIRELINEYPLFTMMPRSKPWELQILPHWSGAPGYAGPSTWRAFEEVTRTRWRVVCDDGWLDGKPDFQITVEIGRLVGAFDAEQKLLPPEAAPAHDELFTPNYQIAEE